MSRRVLHQQHVRQLITGLLQFPPQLIPLLITIRDYALHRFTEQFRKELATHKKFHISTKSWVKSLLRADVMARSFVVGAPGIRLIRRAERGEDGEDDGAAGVTGAGEGSCETAAMASSSVMRRLSLSTLVSWVAIFINRHKGEKNKSRRWRPMDNYTTNYLVVWPS